MSFQLTKRVLPLTKPLLISTTTRRATIITSTAFDETKKNNNQECIDIHALYNNENQSAMEHHYQPSLSTVHYAAGHPHHNADTFSPSFNTIFDE
ncbi:unnamed protein product [Cunninghamella blakesleeana]